MKLILLITLFFASLLWNGEKVIKSEGEWKKLLGKERFRVMRQKGTEQGFLSPYILMDRDGIYSCAACSLPLFDSKAKYIVGAGWPSFKEAIAAKNIYYLKEEVTFFKRYEVLCSRCDSHLGHVFHDGPEPKKLRYTINSISLVFKSRK